MPVQRRLPSRPAGRREAATALATDVACLLAFAAIGRRTHAGTDALDETVRVAAPFVVGWLLAALVVGLPGRPRSAARALRAWALGVPLGLVLRAATGGGVAPPFIAVALVVTLVTLVGRRLVTARLARRRGAALTG